MDILVEVLFVERLLDLEKRFKTGENVLEDLDMLCEEIKRMGEAGE